EDVDLAGLKRGEPLLGGQRSPFHGLRVVEQGCGDGPAEVGVEAGHGAVFLQETEAGQRAVDAADQAAPPQHGLQGALGLAGGLAGGLAHAGPLALTAARSLAGGVARPGPTAVTAAVTGAGPVLAARRRGFLAAGRTGGQDQR